MTDRQLAGLPPHPSEEVFHSFAARGLEQIGRAADVPRDHQAHMLRFSADDAYPPSPLYEVFDPQILARELPRRRFFQRQGRDRRRVRADRARRRRDADEPATPGPTLHLEAMAAALAHQFLRDRRRSASILVLVVAAGLLRGC